MKRKFLALLTVLFALVLGFGVLTACGGSDGELTINEAEVTLAIGESHTLIARGESGEKIEWSTSDDKIVAIQSQVAAQGIAVIKATGAGQATVTAKSDSGKTVECKVTVENIVVEISGEGVQDGKLQMERYTSVKLSAAVKKEGVDLNETVTWSSVDPTIVSVTEDGTVTALKVGTTSIIAARSNGASRGELQVTVTWVEPEGYYELHDWEQNKITPNLWGYWIDAGYESAAVSVSNAEYLGNTNTTDKLSAGNVTLTYENGNDANNEHGVQLFYRSSKGYNEANKDAEGFTAYDESKLMLEVGVTYLLKLDITVSASGTITVNGKQVEVVAGEKQSVVAPFSHTDSGYIYPAGVYDNVGSAVYLMMGANGKMIQAATVTLENVRWEPWDGQTTKLQTPTVTLSGSTVTITDPNTEGVKDYTVGLFEKGADASAEPVRSVVTSEKSATIDSSKWPNGNYELRVRANGLDVRYGTSDWSQGVNYTVSHEAVKYDLEMGGLETAKGDLSDTYYYYVENAVVNEAKYDDGTITLDFEGSWSWTSMQLFYKNPNLTSGTKYTLTFKLNASVAGKIRINWTMFDIKQGDNDIEIAYTEGSSVDGLSLNIQFGEPTEDYQGTASQIEAGKFVFSDLNWTPYTAPAGSIPRGEQGNAVSDPNKWYLWADDNWTGSTVTSVSESVDLEKKELVLEYTTTGVPRLGYSVQLFYENSANVTGTVYTLTLKVTLSVAGTITINDTPYTFTAGETKDLSITYTEKGYEKQYFEGASIAILMGTPVPDGQDGSANAVMNAKITVSDWSWGDVSVEKLQTPTALAISEKTVTFTDPNEAAKVGGYELGFFSGDTLKGTVRITSGGTLNDSAIANGTYTLKVRALGKDASYTASDWSQGVEYTVNNAGGPAYSVSATAGENEVGANPDGKYYYWKESGTVTGSYANGMLTVVVTGNAGNWYNVQIFMADPSLTVGGVYKVTMTLTLNVSGKIKVNGIDPVELTANTPYPYENANWTQQAGAASVSIQLGSEKNGVVAESCSLTVENVTFTPAAKLATPSFTLEGKTVTITDTENTGASYELGFFKKADDAAPANTLTIANGGTINDEMIPAGDYTLKLRATKAGSTPSDWSQGQDYTVVKAATDYTVIAWGQEYGEVSSDGRWFYWTDDQNVGSVEVEYARLYENNGKYTISVKESAKKNAESLSYGFQMFHNDSAHYTKGQQYTLTLKANAKSAFTMAINGQSVTTVANQDVDVSVTFTLSYGATNKYEDISLLDIQIPQTVGTTYEFELKDIAWTAGSGSSSGTTPDSGNQGGQGGGQSQPSTPAEGINMTKLSSKDGSGLVKGQWSYYAAEGVTVKAANVSADGKTVTVTVSGLKAVGDFTLFYTPEGYADGQQHTLVADYLFTSTTVANCVVTLNNCTAGQQGKPHTPGYDCNKAYTGQGLDFITTGGVFFSLTLGFVNSAGVDEVPSGEVTLTLSNITLP